MIIAIPADPYGLPDATTSTHQIRKAAVAFYNANFLGQAVVNAATGWPILLGGTGRKHVTQPSAQAVLLRAVTTLADAITHAELSASVVDKRGRPDVVAVHRFTVELSDGVAGQVLPAQLIVFEQLEARRTVYRFYDLAFLAL